MRKPLTPEQKEQRKIYLKEYHQKNKDKRREKNKEYREKNKEVILKQKKEYYEANKDKINEQKKEYNRLNKVAISNNKKIYRENNKDKIKQYFEDNKEILAEKKKIYRKNNKVKISKNMKDWLTANKEWRQEYKKLFYLENKERIQKYDNEYRSKKRKTDPKFRLKEAIRNSIIKAFKKINSKKCSKTLDILCCTSEEFKVHIESQFKDWMNWDNYGNPKDGILELNKTWDLDHIIPLATAITEEDIIKLNHYTNLQPLCSYTNRKIKRDN